MVNDAVKQMMKTAVPLNGHLGIDVMEMEPGHGVATLPDRPELKNHVGSQHAAGLFAVAEAASGAAVVGLFAERLAELTPLARSAQISYLKIAKGVITATATLDVESPNIEASLAADGKVAFPVSVALTNDQSETVATVTVEWHVRRR